MGTGPDKTARMSSSTTAVGFGLCCTGILLNVYVYSGVDLFIPGDLTGIYIFARFERAWQTTNFFLNLLSYMLTTLHPEEASKAPDAAVEIERSQSPSRHGENSELPSYVYGLPILYPFGSRRVFVYREIRQIA
jgi:hypothetical protein